MGRLVNLQEDILREVFGLGGVAEHPIDGVGHGPFVFIHQFFESAPIASPDAQHQGGIGIEIGGHGCPC